MSRRDRIESALKELNRLWDELPEYRDQAELENNVLEPLYTFAIKHFGIKKPEEL